MKKQYEVPQMTMIVLQTADILLASAEGLTEKGKPVGLRL